MPGHSYKGSSVTGNSPQTSVTPYLYAVSFEEIRWIFTGTNPPEWQFWKLTGVTYAFYDSTSGDARTFTDPGMSGHTFYVVASDSLGNAVPPASNSAIVP